MKVQKKYHNLGHKVLLVKIDKDKFGLGIAISGHRDRNRMAVFICGLNPKGSAQKGGQLHIGDEILEVRTFVFSIFRYQFFCLAIIPPSTRSILLDDIRSRRDEITN